jgi:hypothetical protein
VEVEAVATRKHLVVLLPGIGGSVLEHLDGTTAWDAGFGGIAGLVRDAARLSLAESPTLRPVGLIRSRRLLPGWTVIHGYEKVVKGLRDLPGAIVAPGRPDDPVPDANVVLFPYDFRASLAQAAERLDAEVRGRLERFGGRPDNRVIVVAHSLGGLVARYWLGPLDGWRVCRALITLGTPHRGAPKALHLMVNGVLGGRLPAVRALFREWPSVAELLPRYPAVWDTAAGAARYPHELGIDWLTPLAERAYTVHTDIEQAWRQVPRGTPDVQPRLGWSHRTLNAARWDGTRLSVTKDAPTWLEHPGWREDHGDGTVPAYSAVPVEMSGHSPYGWRVRDRHGPIGSAAFVAELVEFYERYADIGPIRGEDRPAALGLDLDEQYTAGEPVPLRVTMHGDGVDSTGATMSAALRPAGSPAVLDPVRLTRDRDAWVGAFTPPGPGLYDVVVTARNLAGVEDLTALESIAVLDDE